MPWQAVLAVAPVLAAVVSGLVFFRLLRRRPDALLAPGRWSVRSALAGAAGGALVGAASVTFYSLFCTCGAGPVGVSRAGWKVLVPTIAFGALVGVVTAALCAPQDVPGAWVLRFVSTVAIVTGLAFFLLVLYGMDRALEVVLGGPDSPGRLLSAPRGGRPPASFAGLVAGRRRAPHPAAASGPTGDPCHPEAGLPPSASMLPPPHVHVPVPDPSATPAHENALRVPSLASGSELPPPHGLPADAERAASRRLAFSASFAKDLRLIAFSRRALRFEYGIAVTVRDLSGSRTVTGILDSNSRNL